MEFICPEFLSENDIIIYINNKNNYYYCIQYFYAIVYNKEPPPFSMYFRKIIRAKMCLICGTILNPNC